MQQTVIMIGEKIPLGVYEFQILAAETTKLAVLTCYYPARIQAQKGDTIYIFEIYH